MSDNGSYYVSHAFKQALARIGPRHRPVRPYHHDQRKGYTFHPDRAARVGLGQALPSIRGSRL